MPTTLSTGASSSMRPLVIVKLGGSIITVKNRPFTPNIENMETIAQQVSELTDDYSFILVHGGGSYGHVVASEYRISEGFTHPGQLIGLSKVKLRMNELTQLLLSCLASYNVPAVPVTPVSCLTCSSGRIVSFFKDPIVEMLGMGVVPLIPGDIAMDREKRFTIVSGDQVAAYLAIELGVFKLIYGIDADGVFTVDPKQNPDATLIPRLSKEGLQRVVGLTRPGDVTGGILKKICEGFYAAEKGIRVIIGNITKPDALKLMVEREEGFICTILEA
ncbi:MAG: isopentenyl phosphate kinase [Thermoproteota archaeon]